MEKKITGYTLTKEGKFLRPTLTEHNQYRKDGIKYHKQNIRGIREDTKNKIERLQDEIKEIRQEATNDIETENRKLEERKIPTTQGEYDLKSKEAETDLRKFSEESKKRRFSQ